MQLDIEFCPCVIDADQGKLSTNTCSPLSHSGADWDEEKRPLQPCDTEYEG